MKYRIASIVLALIVSALLVLPTGKSPLDVLQSILQGGGGSWEQIARVLTTLAPLLLCSAGLIYTFTAGLYNLGVEGQITVGAIATSLVIRTFQPDGALENTLSPVMTMTLAILAGMLGGALWGMLAGVLNVFGRISEIFAGLGLNFMAQGLAIFLIFGPWKRPGVASMSGTQPFDESLWLPAIGNTELTPVALVLSGLALIITLIIIRNTHFGLRLRAVGRNLRASYVLGIPATRQLLSAFAICGALAGIAGALQAMAVFHRMIPSISSNLGFLALMVVMLVNYNPAYILPIAFFFSFLNIGALRLPSDLKIESALAGVIQGVLVLFALLGRGMSERFGKAIKN